MFDRLLLLGLAATVVGFLVLGCHGALRDAGHAETEDQARFFEALLRAIVGNPMR